MVNMEQLRKQFAVTMTDPVFLKEAGLSREALLAALSERWWQALIRELAGNAGENGRWSSLKAEEIAVRWLAELKEAPPEGWSRHAYLFIREQLFPGMEETCTDPEHFAKGRLLFLQILRTLYRFEEENLPFDPFYTFALLDERSEECRDATPEYARFKKAVHSHYIYEFMRIGTDITPYNTLGHMAGVHYIAMLAARQLKKSGVPVDLGLISGAAAGHDIGKYGCRKEEERRVPYLHYYYSDVCYTRFGLPGMAHIAANHSTWDLELEDLSVESLLLIYADFRVKSIHDGGPERVHIYSLKEAYDVILSKLDNVDEAKKHRYEKVYSKLNDFEQFMIRQGVATEVPADFSSYEDREIIPQNPEIVFLNGEQIIDQLKHLAIDHNVRLMAQFHKDSGVSSIIEAARGELQWKDKRTYLNILTEYSTYMPEKQKLLTMELLYDLLSDREADIRGRAASALGRLVARFREEYKKEIPQHIVISDVAVTNVSLFRKYMDKIMFPGRKLTPQHRDWMQNAAHLFVGEVLANCRENCRHRYVEVLEEYYQRRDLSHDLILVLEKLMIKMDTSQCAEGTFFSTVDDFLSYAGGLGDRELEVGAVLARHSCFPEEGEEAQYGQLLSLQKEHYRRDDFDELLNTMFLDDLKLSTPWVEKIANITIMLYYATHEAGANAADQGRLLHIATHLSNLIKNSSSVTVRLYAGQTIVPLVEKLPYEQRNELAVEMLNGLEIGDYQYSRYIPDYLGKILLYLPPQELDEFIRDLRRLMNEGSEMSAVSVVNTFFVALESYGSYRERFKESEEIYEQRHSRILGRIIKAFAGAWRGISQEAFWVIGNRIFGSQVLTLEEKAELFRRCGKKILMILGEKREKELDFYNNAASLNQIYRFITTYTTDIGPLEIPQPGKVAFFPGTFDPFSHGHKAVARSIRDNGFEVYLALDEFSWSKNTQPHLERRKIMLMSVADEENVYLFADDVPVNIDNPDDLNRLREIFAGRELYIAVGTDVIQNASCYKKKPVPGSIHSMNHITFARQSQSQSGDGEAYPVTGDVIRLSVKKYYEDISSSQIRENINRNRDISNLIDSFAQRYIYQKNLYVREPMYKHVAEAQEIAISGLSNVSEEALLQVKEKCEARGYDFEKVRAYALREDVSTVVIEAGKKTKKVAGIASAHCIDTDLFYQEFHDVEIAARIRRSAGGRAVVIGLLLPLGTRSISNISQVLLTELLTEFLARDYTYVVYHPADPAGEQEAVIEALKRQGFVNIAEGTGRPIYAVDMQAPHIIFRDVEPVIKAPLNKNPHVQHAIETAHNRLLHTLAEIYPGELLLSFHSSVVYNKVINIVAGINGVPSVPSPDKKKGPYMSVPYSKALRHVVVPNTVTKALHVEKYFQSDLSEFRIGKRSGYASLENQAATLRSFNRPVILIEDLLHKRYRLEKLFPILLEQGVDVKATVAGVLTGKARDAMMASGRRVDSAYFIPSINVWLNERDCYPFIGGDGIDADDPDQEVYGTRHVNMVLPYATPSFIRKDRQDAVFKYSMTCLENARDILRVLEEEYQKVFEKNLTLKRLDEVISKPKLPYRGTGMTYDDTLAPSQFLQSDIERLKRLDRR